MEGSFLSIEHQITFMYNFFLGSSNSKGGNARDILIRF
jgi:hypothetical protein